MAYVKRYWGEFADRYNRTITVEIYKNVPLESSGEVELNEMIFTDDPLSWNHPGDDNDIRKSIFGKELSINIMSMTDFQYIELHSSDTRDYKVKVLIDGVLDFEGWILPDLFTEPYVAPPYSVSVSARCGIAELKELDCPQSLETIRIDEIFYGRYTSNKVNLLTLIYRGLREITDNTTIYIDENVNVYPDTDEPDTAGYSPLWYTFINLEEYKEMTWYEAIEDALKALNCRLYQKNGRWRIRRIWEREQIIRKHTIVDDGSDTFLASLDFTETYTPTYKIGKPENRFLVGGGQLDISPALKKYTIQNNFELNVNLFKNGDFKDTLPGVGGFTTIYSDKERVYKPIKNWDVVGDDKRYKDLYAVKTLFEEGGFSQSFYDANFEQISLNNILRQVQIDSETVGMFMPSGIELFYANDAAMDYQQVYIKGIERIKYIDPDDIYLTLNSGNYTGDNGIPRKQSIKLSIEVACIGNSESDNNLGVVFSIVTYTKQWLKSDGDGGYVWSTEENEMKFTVSPSNFDNPNFQTIEIITDYIESFNLYYFQIINNNLENSFLFKNISAQIIESEIKEDDNIPYYYPEQVNNNFDIKSQNVKVGETIELVSGDLPDVPNNAKIWNGGFRLIDDTPISKWHQSGETIELPIVQLNALQFSSLKSIPQFKLSLPIMSNDIDFDKNIVDYQILPKEYICNSFNYNYRNCIGEGTYMEIATWGGADWILEDGTWNDQGVWVDGETWNDEDPTPP